MTAEFVKLTSRHGVSCSANACGNVRLREAVLREARTMSSEKLAPSEVAAFREQLRKAFQPARQAKPDWTAAPAKPREPYRLPRTVDGWRVVYVKVENAVGAAREFVVAHALALGGTWFAGVLLALGMTALNRRRRPALLSLSAIPTAAGAAEPGVE